MFSITFLLFYVLRNAWNTDIELTKQSFYKIKSSHHFKQNTSKISKSSWKKWFMEETH